MTKNLILKVNGYSHAENGYIPEYSLFFLTSNWSVSSNLSIVLFCFISLECIGHSWKENLWLVLKTFANDVFIMICTMYNIHI